MNTGSRAVGAEYELPGRNREEPKQVGTISMIFCICAQHLLTPGRRRREHAGDHLILLIIFGQHKSPPTARGNPVSQTDPSDYR